MRRSFLFDCVLAAADVGQQTRYNVTVAALELLGAHAALFQELLLAQLRAAQRVRVWECASVRVYERASVSVSVSVRVCECASVRVWV